MEQGGHNISRLAGKSIVVDYQAVMNLDCGATHFHVFSIAGVSRWEQIEVQTDNNLRFDKLLNVHKN